MPNIQHKRGTRAALDALAASSGLVPWQVYAISDESRLALALTASTYQTFLKTGEAGGGGGGAGYYVGPTAPDPGVYPLWFNTTAGAFLVYVSGAWVEPGATLDPDDFVPRAGSVTMTGPLSVPAGASGAQVPQAQEIGTLADAQLTTHYKRSNILGAVSQSGGVPTGAVIENGSNANGSYVRFADGTQVCWHSVTTSATASVGWTFPAQFTGAAPAIAFMGASAAVPVITTLNNLSTVSVELHGWAVSGGRQAASNLVMAIGRWF